MPKRAFRAAISSEQIPNYPSLAEFRLSPRAIVAGISAALIASSCVPAPADSQPSGIAPMPIVQDAGGLDASGIPEMPPDGGIPEDPSADEPAADLPDAGQ